MTCAGHRIRAGPDQGGDVQALEAGILARQSDRGGGIAPGGGDRQRSVGRHPESQAELVEFDPAHLDVAEQGGERREADLAARGREHRAALPVQKPKVAEAQSDAPGVVHEIGRTEFDDIGPAEPLLQTRGDPVVQPGEVDRAAGQPERQQRDGRERDKPHGLGDVDADVANMARAAGAAIAGRQARALGGAHHALHGRLCARPVSDPEPAHQTTTILS